MRLYYIIVFRVWTKESGFKILLYKLNFLAKHSVSKAAFIDIQKTRWWCSKCDRFIDLELAWAKNKGDCWCFNYLLIHKPRLHENQILVMLLKHDCEWLILASCVSIVQMKVTLKLELHIVFFLNYWFLFHLSGIRFIQHGWESACQTLVKKWKLCYLKGLKIICLGMARPIFEPLRLNTKVVQTSMLT